MLDFETDEEVVDILVETKSSRDTKEGGGFKQE